MEKNNHVLVDKSFSSILLKEEEFKHHILQPGAFIYWKRYLWKNSPQPHWRGPY